MVYSVVQCFGDDRETATHLPFRYPAIGKGCTKLLGHPRNARGVTDRTQLRQGGRVSSPILQVADVPVQAETILEVPEEVHPLHVSRYVLAGQHDRNRAVFRGPSFEDAG